MADEPSRLASKDRAKIDLTFSEIKYSVQVKKESKQILHGISGSVDSGSMMCVLGPSGSGKTSLIHIISSKLASGAGRDISGSVKCNGLELSASQFQRIAGLVTQEDVFNAALTVKETLRFGAKLRLQADHQERIDSVVRKLQLEKCLSTYVGDDSNPYLKGISGGEKRRLAIAVEIMDPSISLLVLDEPTSGLDAAAALNVANLLRSLADTQIAVVATVHQPRATIVAQFNSLMVLADGLRVFYGSLDKYIPYLEADLQCNVPMHENPYDFLLDMLNPLIREQSKVPIGALAEDCTDVSTALAELYDKSELKRKTDESASSPASDPMRSSTVEELLKSRRRGVGWIAKFITIFHRTFLIKMRDPMVMATQLSTAIMLGVIFGLLYWQSYDKEKEFVILDTQMICVMCTMMCVWLPYDVTLTFPKERQIFLRERKAGLYTTSSFYFARITADMPMHIVAATIMACIVYPMAGLRQNIGYFILVNVCAVLVGASMMQMIGSVSKTFEEANILMMLIMMLSMVMSTGFTRQVPDFLIWMREISVMGLVADLAIYFEFIDVDPMYGTPEQVLAGYGARIRDTEDVVLALWILLSIYLVARTATFLGVKFVHTGRSFRENLVD
jgi:ABC-type multidrug transport system ATPase subunit